MHDATRNAEPVRQDREPIRVYDLSWLILPAVVAAILLFAAYVRNTPCPADMSEYECLAHKVDKQVPSKK